MRKVAYLALHPETAAGNAGAIGKHGAVATLATAQEQGNVVSFVEESLARWPSHLLASGLSTGVCHIQTLRRLGLFPQGGATRLDGDGGRLSTHLLHGVGWPGAEHLSHPTLWPSKKLAHFFWASPETRFACTASHIQSKDESPFFFGGL